MRSVRQRLFSLAALVLTGAGCERILGIDDIEYVPAEADECVLSTEGNARFRLGNLVPSKERVDVCLRREGSAWPEEALFASSGAKCPKGVGYRQMTVPASIKAGRYTVRVVPAGSECAAAGRTLDKVDLANDTTTSLFLFGGEFDEASVRALEDSPPELLEVRVRFVHGLNGVGDVDAGVTNAEALPAKLSQAIFRGVPFAGVSRPVPDRILPVEDGGYMQVGAGEAAYADFPIGVAEAGDTEAMLVLPTDFEGGGAYSLFALGTKGSPAYPPSLWVCNEKSGDGVFATCGQPIDLKVDAFDPSLTDRFTEAVEERTEPVVEALADAESDLMCITEVYPPDISDRIVRGTQSRFADNVDSNTLVGKEDRAGWDGKVPDFEGPFCAGDQEAMLDTILEVLRASSCVEQNGDESFPKSGGAEAIQCLGKALGEDFLGFMGDEAGANAPANARCWMCAIAHLSGYESLEGMRELCTTDAQPFFAFRGTTGLVVLSKHKLGVPELYLLPSTAWQRAVLRVPVRLKNGASFDFYCADLAYPHPDLYIPYVGPYGNGEQGTDGEAQEQLLEARRLRRLVEKHSTARGVRAIVAGVFFSGPEVETEDGAIVAEAASPDTWTELTRSLEPLVASGYEPTCTWCSNNPWQLSSEKQGGQQQPVEGGVWSTHLFGEGFSQADVQMTERTFLERSVSAGTSGKMPVSPHYGVRSTLVVTQ